jgi:hypothetical protein
LASWHTSCQPRGWFTLPEDEDPVRLSTLLVIRTVPLSAIVGRGIVVSTYMWPMAELRYIETEAQWDAALYAFGKSPLPVGTLARVGSIEHDDGKYWAEIWGWENGTHAADTAAIRDEDAPEPASLRLKTR